MGDDVTENEVIQSENDVKQSEMTSHNLIPDEILFGSTRLFGLWNSGYVVK